MNLARKIGFSFLGGITGIVGIYYKSDYLTHKAVLPILHRLDPETSHDITIKMLSYGIVPRVKKYHNHDLNVTLWNQNFINPVGLAAGFDKQAEAYPGLSKLGFGFIELGSVTNRPQPGNPKPRIFRYGDNIVNRCGFNSDGLDKFISRLDRTQNLNCAKIGINIGANKITNNCIEDYRTSIKAVETFADYIVINISSPNTPGLRDLQEKNKMEQLIVSTRNLSKKPLLFKLSPDLEPSQLTDIMNLVQKYQIDGLIISNTTKSSKGGISGPLLKRKSNEMIFEVYKQTHGRVPIIGVGGISSGEDAYQRIKNGASLIQIYTSFIMEGPEVVYKINRDLHKLLKKDGYKNIQEAIGKNHK